MEWMILPLRRYAQFSGRSQRKEYWMFILFTVIVSLVFNVLDDLLGLGGHLGTYATQSADGFAARGYSRGGLLSSLWSLAVLLPSIAVGVRRLHDVNRTGWWMLGPVVPFFAGAILLAAGGFMAMGAPQLTGQSSGSMIVGAVLLLAGGIVSIVLLVWFCTDGTHGANRFGPDPKGHMSNLQETFR